MEYKNEFENFREYELAVHLLESLLGNRTVKRSIAQEKGQDDLVAKLSLEIEDIINDEKNMHNHETRKKIIRQYPDKLVNKNE